MKLKGQTMTNKQKPCEHNTIFLDWEDGKVSAGCESCGIMGDYFQPATTKRYDIAMASSIAVHNFLYTAPSLLKEKRK